MSVKSRVNKGNTVWDVRVDLGFDPVTGKRRQRMETHETKAKAEAREREWRTTIAGGTVVDTTKITVRELAEQWLATVEKRGRVSPTTLSQYRYTTSKYILPVLGGKKIQRLTIADVQSCYDALTSHPETARKTHLRLRQMLTYARRQQWLVRSVVEDADVPRSKPKERETWTAPEAEAFLAAAERECDEARDDYGPLWRLALFTGMRRGELLGLRWRDVDLTKGTLVVQQSVGLVNGRPYLKDGKTAASRRSISLPASTVSALREHRKNQNEKRLAAGPLWQGLDLVFTAKYGGLIDPNNIKRPFAAIIRRAGVRRITFHALRHTHATLLLSEGANIKMVSARLGHAKTSTTLDVYAHVLPGMQEQAVNILDSLFGT